METEQELYTERLVLEERKILYLDGIVHTGSLDEKSVSVFTENEKIIVKGEGLQLERLDPDKRKAVIRGLIQEIRYSDALPKAAGFLEKVFR